MTEALDLPPDYPEYNDEEVEAEVSLPDKMVEVFEPPRGAVQFRGVYGGRGSGKSYNFAKMAAIWGYIWPLRILCTRDIQASIKESFHAELKSAIASEPWLQEHYDVGVDYLRGINGTEFLFYGLRRNISNVKSLAKIDLTIMEEAEDVSEDAFIDLEPTVFRQPDAEMWVIWNPKKDGSPVDTRLRKHPPENSVVVEMNWWDNQFFPAGLDKLRERDRIILDPGLYAHIWEGQYLKNTAAQVLGDKCKVLEFKPRAQWDGPYYGGDFGFSQDPTVAVEVWIHGNNLYIYREAHKVGLDIDKTKDFVCAKIPGYDKRVSRWDSSRPETISFLKRHGMPKATSVKKWSGSVADGILHLRSYGAIYIHPQCKEMIKEAHLYSYKIDRLTKDVTDEIVDAYNHGWDAVRYALGPIIKPKSQPRVRVG